MHPTAPHPKDQCPCGSGRQFRKCCKTMAKVMERASRKPKGPPAATTNGAAESGPPQAGTITAEASSKLAPDETGSGGPAETVPPMPEVIAPLPASDPGPPRDPVEPASADGIEVLLALAREEANRILGEAVNKARKLQQAVEKAEQTGATVRERFNEAHRQQFEELATQKPKLDRREQELNDESQWLASEKQRLKKKKRTCSHERPAARKLPLSLWSGPFGISMTSSRAGSRRMIISASLLRLKDNFTHPAHATCWRRTTPSASALRNWSVASSNFLETRSWIGSAHGRGGRPLRGGSSRPAHPGRRPGTAAEYAGEGARPC